MWRTALGCTGCGIGAATALFHLKCHSPQFRTGPSSATVPINVNASTGSATIDISAVAGDLFAGTETAVITVPAIAGVASYTLELPAAALSGPQGEGAVTFSTAIGSLTVPGDMLTGIPGAEGKEAGITIARGDTSGLPDEVKEAIGDVPSFSFP